MTALLLVLLPCPFPTIDESVRKRPFSWSVGLDPIASVGRLRHWMSRFVDHRIPHRIPGSNPDSISFHDGVIEPEEGNRELSSSVKNTSNPDAMQAALVHTRVPLGKKRNDKARRRQCQVRAVWLDNVAKVEAPVPVSRAFELWNDRTQIPAWMPWITSVTVMDEDPALSRWTLSTDPLKPPFNRPFGQRLEYSWVARNLTPLPNQKVHWTSVEGLSNRGAVRFYSQGVEKCTVELIISYECPDVLLPVASAVRPLVERILVDDLKRFATYAVEGNNMDEDVPSEKKNA